ncbi:NAD+ kinase [Luteococcus japonicus]|uniref:NAD kinase n=2 Tax=Propionibacteriaceae TaxID=31957 RepID=A0A3N2A087_9ACTN|nr:NAD+ kinase [Luteococcus japonicus]
MRTARVNPVDADQMQMNGDRAVAVLLHPSRPDALDAAVGFIAGIAERGFTAHVLAEAYDDVSSRVAQQDIEVGLLGARNPGLELVVVFGGDGSILRGAEQALPWDVPLLGVNLGHVGFLAELEASEIDDLVDRVDSRAYEVEKRLTLAVEVHDPSGHLVWESFAVNEVSVEKIARERMLEVLAIVDDQPLSRWGCDGILVSTPTGSTAYAFSSGGPVMWPDVEAIELVPLSAHALFARPAVLSPKSTVDLVVSSERNIPAVVWADGARTVDAGPGSRVRLRRGAHDLLIARLRPQPFTTRLVKKFGLPVEGFRGRG